MCGWEGDGCDRYCTSTIVRSFRLAGISRSLDRDAKVRDKFRLADDGEANQACRARASITQAIDRHARCDAKRYRLSDFRT